MSTVTVEERKSALRGFQEKSAPIRAGDKFRCEDGIWEVLYTHFGDVTMQCREQHMQITHPASVVKTWERVS